MKKFYILITFLFSLTLNAMEEAPKPNEICWLAALPGDVQNEIGSYFAEDDISLRQRLLGLKKSIEKVSALKVYKKIRATTEVGERREMVTPIADILPLVYSASQDGTKLLIDGYHCAIIRPTSKNFLIYDVLSKKSHIINIKFSESTPVGNIFPLAISNDGQTFIMREINFARKEYNLETLRIKQKDNEKTYDVPFEPDLLIESASSNKQNTKITLAIRDHGTLVFSRKFPKKDPNCPENLLSQYFREKGICKTLSKQNPNLNKRLE